MQDRGATDERIVDGVVRVLGGGSDQRHHAPFNIAKQYILLALRKSVDLVEEQDARWPAIGDSPPRGIKHFTDLFDSNGRRIGRGKRPVAFRGDDLRQRRFASARGPPQNE